MSGSTYFIQECPTCGRKLQIRVAYLGRHVVCQHCSGQFEACDPQSEGLSPSDSGSDVLRRAEELLNTADQRKAYPR